VEVPDWADFAELVSLLSRVSEQPWPAKCVGNHSWVGDRVAEIRVVWNPRHEHGEGCKRRQESGQKCHQLDDGVSSAESIPLVFDKEPDHKRLECGDTIFVEEYCKQGPEPSLMIGCLR
jgi:hypothetical protein